MIKTKYIWKYVSIIIMAVLVVVCFTAVFNLMYSNQNSPLALNGDTVWSISFSSGILKDMSYPKVVDKMIGPIGYPVPMLLFLQLVKQLPLSVFSVFFEIAYLVLPLGCLYLLIELCGLKIEKYRWIVALGAFIVTWEYLQFDIRALNINIVLLTLVLLSLYYLQQGREGLAGLILACSVVVKLYSVFIILLWLYKKKYRAFVVFAVMSILFFIIIPALVLGVTPAFNLTLDWLAGVKSTSTAQAVTLMSCYLVSLNRAVVTVFGVTRETGAAVLSENTWLMLNFALGVFKLVWLFFAGWAVFKIERAPKADRMMRQAAVLLVIPIAISPLLQPHHLVLIMPAVFILCKIVISQEFSSAARIMAGMSAFVVLIFSLFISVDEMYRGFIYSGISLVLILGMIYLPLKNKTDN